MASLIFAFLTFLFGYGLGRWGWDNIKAWAVGAAAAVAAWWDQISGFVTGLVG